MVLQNQCFGMSGKIFVVTPKKAQSVAVFSVSASRARILQTNPSLERARIYKLGSRRLGKARILPFATPLYPGEGRGGL